MHEWLTVIIVLLIIGIFLDGIRRMRQVRQNARRMELDTEAYADRDDVQERSRELPNGGARIAHRPQKSQAEHINRKLRKAIETEKQPVSTPSATVQQAINLEDDVPMLMNSVAAIDSNDPKPKTKQEPRLGAELEIAPAASDKAPELASKLTPEIKPELNKVSAEAVQSPKRVLKRAPTKVSLPEKPSTQTLSTKKGPASKQVHQKKPFSKLLSRTPTVTKPTVMPEEVLILHVEAVNDDCFAGEHLLKLLLNEGLRYGEMNIFHRHTEEDGEGPILFSIANMVVPGAFDLGTFNTLLTPGVSAFLRLPIADYDATEAFKRMLVTAKTLADKLGGELRDDQHSVMTRQTVQHYLERIRHFLLKQQLLERA